MAESRWNRIKAIVEAALDRRPEEREAFVHEVCGDDEELRAEVLDLLAHAVRDDDPTFLEPPPDPARQSLGEFELLREIGRGGMAVVYLANQPRLSRQVAVKVMTQSLSTPEVHVERFHREARAAAKLRHPGIVQVYADGVTDSAHWFAMEFVDGHDLERELKLQKAGQPFGDQRPFLPSPGEPGHIATIAALCADVADALQYAHDHGLVHRDIKPQNLLLQPDRRVLIGDFGLVRDETLGSLTVSGDIAGTPHYMSPEQARVRKTPIDSRTDLYSLGVVLYEMATLRRPFEGESSAEVLGRILRFEPRSIRQIDRAIPRDLETICMKAMARDPRDRYQSARELAADLRRFVGHEAITAKPPSRVELAVRWMQRHYRAVGAIAILVFGVGFGSFWTWRTLRTASLATVSLRAFERSGAPVDATASFVPIDPLTGVRGETVGLGTLPVDRAYLEPAFGRLVVRAPGVGFAEFDRLLERGEAVDIESRLPPMLATSGGGMVFVEGGVLAFDEDEPLSPLDGVEVEVESFWIDACETSNVEYRAFLDATGHPPPPYWDRVESPEHDDLPVVYVGWHDARAYAEWVGKRLPTFAEWTLAARGVEGRPFPWGDGAYRGNTRRARVDAGSSAERMSIYFDSAVAVGSMPEASTPEGAFHMMGNVAEWTASLAPLANDTGLVPHDSARIIAGFAWDAADYGSGYTLSKFGFGDAETETLHSVGFRCARSTTP